MPRTIPPIAQPTLWPAYLARYLRSWWYMIHLGAIAVVFTMGS